ncbi:MAG: response regulator, partial [Acidobacteriota bacterium]
MRIVLAEDQAMVLGALAALLDLEDDFEVVGRAVDGDDARAKIAALRPDVVVTDIEMPGLTGLELAAGLEPPPRGPAVVILTTFARPGYLRRALDAGVRGYLLKDAPSEELAEALRTVAAGGRAIAPALAAEAWGASDPLTDRERQTLRLAGEGHSTSKIAG